MFKKIKKLFCSHVKLFIAIDLDELKNKHVMSARCLDCDKKIQIMITAYSLMENPESKNGCLKRKYQNKKEALTVMNRCHKKTRKVQPKRVYECKKCNAWHLTSLTNGF